MQPAGHVDVVEQRAHQVEVLALAVPLGQAVGHLLALAEQVEPQHRVVVGRDEQPAAQQPQRLLRGVHPRRPRAGPQVPASRGRVAGQVACARR